jgi:RNA polymerase sigma-70 factor (ECF subfamily)
MDPQVSRDDSIRATSVELLRLARDGDQEALDELFERHFPPLRRWAHGRLPQWVRNIAETADLVQDAMFNAFRRIDAVEIKRKGALGAYLRQSIQNRVRDEYRSFARRKPHDPIETGVASSGPSPLDLVLDAETSARYRAAVRQLRPGDQELIVGRLELEYTYEQLAAATGRRSVDAVRVALRRALLRLADAMSDASP